MVQVRNTKTNQVIDVPEDEATRGGQTGEYAFKSGQQYSVKNDDGTVGTYNAEDLPSVLGGGFSLAKGEDLDRYKQAQQAQLNKDTYGDMEGTAFAKGALSTLTFGGSDLAIKAAGLADASKQVSEQNPIADIAGQVTGGVASAFTPWGAGLAGIGAKAGEAAAAGVRLANPLAQAVTKRAVAMGLGSAIEGAAYGLGQGVTEASLGKPEDVVQNLASGGLIGSVAGGVLGTALGGGSVLAKSLIKLGLDNTSEIVQAAAKKSIQKLLGGNADAQALSELSTADRATLFSPGADATSKALEKEAAQAQTQLGKDAEAFKREAWTSLQQSLRETDGKISSINDEIAGVKDAASEFVTPYQKDVNLANADLQAAKASQSIMKSGVDQIGKELQKTAKDGLDVLGQARDWAQVQAQDQIDAFSKVLVSKVDPTKSEIVDGIGNNLKTILDKMKGKDATSAEKIVAEQVLEGANKFGIIGPIQGQDSSLGLDVQKLMDFRTKVIDKLIPAKFWDPGAKRLASDYDAAYAQLAGLRRDITSTLANPEVVGKDVAQGFVDRNASYAGFKNFQSSLEGATATRTKLDKTIVRPSLNKAKRAFQDPDVTANILGNLDKFPDILHAINQDGIIEKISMSPAKFAEYLGNKEAINTQGAVVNQLSATTSKAKVALSKAKQTALETIQAASDAKSSEMAQLISESNTMKQAFGGSLSGKDVQTVMDIAQQFNVGTDAAAKASKLQGLYETLSSTPGMTAADKMSAIAEATGQKSHYQDWIDKYANSYDKLQQLHAQVPAKDGPNPLKYLIPGIGHPLAVIDAASTAVGNPYAALKTLTRIERGAQSGARALNTGLDAVIDGVTSKTAARIGSIAVTDRYTPDMYPKIKDALAQYQDPGQATNLIAGHLKGMEAAPNLSTQVSNHLAAVANFQYSKLPQDLFQGKTLGGNQTGWLPSKAQMASFDRSARTAENPMNAINNFAKGVISKEEVEALHTIYPQIYTQLQQRVTEALAKPEAKVLYQKKLQLSTMFGVTTDPTLSPQYILTTQQNYDTMNQPTQTPKAGPAPKADSVEQLTDVQRVSNT